MEESKENFKKIKSANQMMLDYFNKSFLSQLEDIQNLKTQIFEIDIKIDELDKTILSMLLQVCIFLLIFLGTSLELDYPFMIRKLSR